MATALWICPPNVLVTLLSPMLNVPVLLLRFVKMLSLGDVEVDDRPLIVWLVPFRSNLACTVPLMPLRMTLPYPAPCGMTLLRPRLKLRVLVPLGAAPPPLTVGLLLM